VAVAVAEGEEEGEVVEEASKMRYALQFVLAIYGFLAHVSGANGLRGRGDLVVLAYTTRAYEQAPHEQTLI